MTILVAGSAAHEDLILDADRQPSSSEVATLAINPGSKGIWLPGGAARTISLAARMQGADVRLWYPQPVTDRAIALLEEMGVDISQTPVQDIDAVRCLLVYGNEGRLAWSTRLLSVAPAYIERLLEGVTHTVISPVWGPWADILVEACDKRDIPVSLIGDASPQARAYKWHTVILDAEQFSAIGDIKCETAVVTDGERGATVRRNGALTKIEAVKVRVVDTTGAGDTFGGSFLACRLLGQGIADAGNIAAKIAARACEGWGSWAAFEKKEQAKLSNDIFDRIEGALLATACGDAFGMPNSFLKSPPWRSQMDVGPEDSPYHAGYPAGRITDDTEQALALTDALEEGFTPEIVARHLNDWFVSVGGEDSLAVGPSTKRALMAYQAGAPVSEIGRFGVTNGAAMRISPIGVYGAIAGLTLEQLGRLVAIACMPTHATSPAISGALALAAAISAGIEGKSWEEVMAASVAGARLGAEHGNWIYAADMASRIELARRLASQASSKLELARLMSEVVGAGEPTTESVPAAIGIADFARGNPTLAIEIAGNLRGDTDTVAAMAGAVCGAFAGASALPKEWGTLVEVTNSFSSRQWAERLQALAERDSAGAKRSAAA
ncbi:PfkB family carbohydrate kinase [Rhizobium lusitanum]|uniref:PfkB family carbohydrate kinase n=2 Tax=Rhizobium TaxID=379 RepID=UPI0019582D71|nr:PfkB family carbohydrate kinase [Rhizobium lusitanum]MBM7044757.1 ADP-ribosylglycohydrolase family protein [Rhizobium lusitanum]